MARKQSAEELASTLEGKTPFALIDRREPAEYNSSHIPGSSLIPRWLLEFQMASAVPLASGGIAGGNGVVGNTDVLYSGLDQNYAYMMNYLRWETALGEKYAK